MLTQVNLCDIVDTSKENRKGWDNMGKVKRREWTQEEIEKMKQLYHDGMNFTQIGREIGRDKSVVRVKLQALGIHEKDTFRKMANTVYLYDVESIRGHIINIDEAKQLTRGSEKRILFKCSTPNCDNTKMMYVHRLVNRGYSCPTCSTGTSYPELFMLAYLQVKNIPHETQVLYEEIPTRSYDFRIKLNGITSLVETHGEQHFLIEDKTYYKVKSIQESDSIKRNYARENNINYIELDCRESTFEFIRKQIELNEHLPNINDEDIEPMLEVIEQNKKYPVKEICEMYLRARKSTYQIAEFYGYDYQTINRILQRNNVSLRDANASQGKKVRCIETGVVYASTMEVQRQLGIANQNISRCCRGNQHSAGGFTWEYLLATEENAMHRAQYRHDNSETDTIELDDSIDLSAMLNSGGVKPST